MKTHFIRWIFEVGTETAEAIKIANFGAYTELDRGIFKILRDPNKKPGEADDVMEVEPNVMASTSQVSKTLPILCMDNVLPILEELNIDSSSDTTLQPSSPFSESEFEKLLQRIHVNVESTDSSTCDGEKNISLLPSSFPLCLMP